MFGCFMMRTHNEDGVYWGGVSVWLLFPDDVQVVNICWLR